MDYQFINFRNTSFARFVSGIAKIFLAVCLSVSAVMVNAGAVISTSKASIGINNEGDLIYQGVGIRYVPTGGEALAPGCACEGWGVADAISRKFAKAGRTFGRQNVVVESFESDVESAKSVVLAASIMRVTHEFTVSETEHLFRVLVSIENISESDIELLYRRAMDWDVPPTTFSEMVTIVLNGARDVVYASDNGFADGNPLVGAGQIRFVGEAADNGPADHGAVFDFNFGVLKPGETKQFAIYYGAARNEGEALNALSQVGAEVYSLGKPNPASSLVNADGSPNTFIFGFGGVGGRSVVRKLPDYTIGGLKLIDKGQGQPFEISARVGNAGHSESVPAETVNVHFYAGDPTSGGTLLGVRAINNLAPGRFEDITLSDVPNIYTGDIYALVDYLNEVEECREGNNQHVISITPANIVANIEVSTDAPVYYPGQLTLINSKVHNNGFFGHPLSAHVTLVDESNNLVYDFGSTALGEVSGGEIRELGNQWGFTGIAAGFYFANADLLDSQGNVISTARTGFKLDHDYMGSPAANVGLSTDRLEYHTSDIVKLEKYLENISTNLHITDATLEVSILNGDGVPVFNEVVSGVSIVPQQMIQNYLDYPLNLSSPGTYTARIALVRNDGFVYASDTAQFEVRDNPLASLIGSVFAQDVEIESGNDFRCEFKIANAGVSDLAAQNIQYSVVNIDAEEVRITQSTTLNLSSQQEVIELKSFSSSGFAAGTYACVLGVLDAEGLRNIASSQFAVKESPVRLNGDITFGEKARLLVLMDASSTERAYLEDLLINAGWFYTIVDNAAAFAAELNQGGYGVYALLSEKVTLDQATQNLLDVNVAAGDGLIVAGATDRRHQTLEQVLGISARANEAYAKGLAVQDSELGLAWEQVFNQSARVQNFTANGATVIGEYRNNLPGADTQTVLGALGAAGRYGNFVWDNFTSLSSTIEGRIAVGGNLSLQNFSVGDKLDPSKLHDVVTVGGNVTFPSGRIYYGNLIAGGSVAGVGDAVRFGMAPDAVIQGNASMPINFTGEREYLQELSTNLANLPANGTVQMQWGGLELKGDCSSNSQVFNVNGADLGIAHTFAVSCIPAGATVVFNVSGQNVSIKSMGMQSLSAFRDKVLFNFPQATSLTMTSVGIEGSILAPFAQVNQPAGRVDGQVIVKTWYSTNWGYMSIHNRFFGGDLSAAMGPASKNALSIYQYEQGKSVFVGFDVLAQATALGLDDENPFAHLLLSALEHVNPAPITAKAGKTIPVVVTYENTGGQAVAGQVKLSLGNNISVINAGDFSPVANSTDWTLPLNLDTGASQSQLIYVKLPASGSSGIQLQLQTGTAPDWVTRFEKTLELSIQ